LIGIKAILPACNKASIGSMALRAEKYADCVIMADNGSHDRTAEVVKLDGTSKISNYREAFCH